jgi:hypothetical protein
MKITRENLKNIVREAMVEESAYQEFFKKALEKTGKSIPQMSDDEKKAFFNKIDSAWKGKGEKKESVDEIEEEAVVVSKRTPSGTIVSKLKEENESVNEATTKKIVIKVSELGKYDSYRDLFNRAWHLFVLRYVKQNNIKFKNFTEADYIVKKELKIPSSESRHYEDAARYLEDKGILVLKESVNERMGSDKGAVGNANFNNRLKAMRDAKNSVVVYIDTNKGKKLLKVFKTQQTAQQFKKKNMDKLLNTKGVESVGTMPKKEWDAKEAKYAIK